MMISNILIVEDNPYDEELALHTLQNIQTIRTIDVARDGKEALEYLFGKEDAPQPTFILLDLKLPKVEGVEVLEKIKTTAKTKKIPTIIFSSSQLKDDRQTCYELGANSYISKPVAFDEYVRVVTEIGTYWSTYNLPVPTEVND
jgi:CheY-like chemotaxis protein